MQPLLRSLLHSLALPVLEFAAVFVLVFAAVLVILFPYQWLWILQPQSVGVRHFQEKRYEEAAAAFHKVLRRRPPIGVEADTRRRLADTLDVLGRPEAAAAERERAGAVTMRAGTDPTALQTQGTLLERQGRHDDACLCFEQALKAMPNVPGGGRAQIMAKLALAHHNAGRSVETLRWAQASLANGPDKVVRPLMFRVAGVALSDQGDLEQAEVQHRLSLELVEKAKNLKEIAAGLVMLASLQHKRGRFEEAIAAARRAREIAHSPSHTDLAVEAECLRDMGRFNEARAVMRQRFDGPRFDQPHVERKMQALGELGMAWIEARAEQPEAAWGHLEAARAGLKAAAPPGTWPPPAGGGEEKLVLWCDATAANILAQQGRDLEARRLRDNIEGRLSAFATDNATLRGTFGHLARTSLRMGDLSECRDYCRRYDECHPPPAVRPTIHYLLGEAALRIREIETARKAFRQAVAPGIDSLDARRAQARLDEMGG